MFRPTCITMVFGIAVLCAACHSPPSGPPERAPAANTKNAIDDPNRLEIVRPGACEARVGQPVLFRYGYSVVPEMIFSLKVKINGQEIEQPDIESCARRPTAGYADLAYVFRPPQPGTYRIEISRCFLSGTESLPDEHTVVVR